MRAACVLKNVLGSPEWGSFFPPIRCALIHSSPVSLARRSSSDSENHIRYSVREKRSDAKEALRNLCFNGTSSKQFFQDEGITRRANRKSNRNVNLGNDFGESDKYQRSKSAGKCKVSGCKKSKYSKNRRGFNGQSFDDDSDNEHPNTTFAAGPGGQRCFTWSFSSGETLHYENISNGFQWRDDSQQAKSSRRVWNESDIEEESTDDGMQSHRLALGLPVTGSLTLDNVKCAFHASALKWHPDKHQGPSKAAAEEKFKACVDAYKSLCNALR